MENRLWLLSRSELGLVLSRDETGISRYLAGPVRHFYAPRNRDYRGPERIVSIIGKSRKPRTILTINPLNLCLIILSRICNPEERGVVSCCGYEDGENTP